MGDLRPDDAGEDAGCVGSKGGEEGVRMDGRNPEWGEVARTEVAEIERHHVRPRLHGGSGDMPIVGIIRHRGNVSLVSRQVDPADAPHGGEQAVGLRFAPPQIRDESPSRLRENRVRPAHAAHAGDVGVEQKIADVCMHDDVRVEHDMGSGHGSGGVRGERRVVNVVQAHGDAHAGQFAEPFALLGLVTGAKLAEVVPPHECPRVRMHEGHARCGEHTLDRLRIFHEEVRRLAHVGEPTLQDVDSRRRCTGGGLRARFLLRHHRFLLVVVLTGSVPRVPLCV